MLNKSTEIYDEMGPIGEDERWEIFEEFHDYLAQAFPLM
jgi:Gly-Xaa carboxypeptidase